MKAWLLYDNSFLRAIRLSKVAFRGLGFAKRVPLQDRRKTEYALAQARAHVRVKAYRTLRQLHSGSHVFRDTTGLWDLVIFR